MGRAVPHLRRLTTLVRFPALRFPAPRLSARAVHLLFVPVFSVPLLVISTARASAQTGLPPGLTAALEPGIHLPAGSYTPARSWNAVSPAFSHATGHAVRDPAAEGGTAWEGQVGTDHPAAHLLFGPYARLDPGDYVAFFRLERTGAEDEDAAVDLDSCVQHGQEIVSSRELQAADLPQGRYVEAPLPVHYTGGDLELRVYWPGYASVRVDRVALYRVTGASLTDLLPRASAAVPSGKPDHLQPVPAQLRTPDLFPRSSPPARRLLVVDLRNMAPSWQMLYLSLQGLVNRQQPRIYCLFNGEDQTWLNWMRQRHWIDAAQNVARPAGLLQEFRGVFRGLVVTDPRLPASRNVATMLAGVDNLLPASPAIARQLRIPVTLDLRGRWHTSAEAYQWSFDHLWPRLSHQVIACSYPDQMGLRDYLVENRVFLFWISGPIDGSQPGANPTAEVRLMERLLARMPVNIPVMSYPYAGKDVGIGEGPGVTLFAEFGKYLVGTIDCSNLSVHSGINPGRFAPRPTPPLSLNPGKVYVAWVISDGDNLPVLTSGNFPQLWNSPVRGKIPLGWTVSPSAWMLIPDIFDYYYRTASPQDSFLGAVSGIGYTYPDSYGARYVHPRSVFDGFLDQTGKYLRRMGLDDEWIMGITHEDLVAEYARRIPFLQGIYPDYGRRVSSYEDATYPTVRNVPVFHAVTSWAESIPREQQIQNLVEEIRAITPTQRPAFLQLFALNWFTDLPELQDVLHRLGPEYEAVRPDSMAALYRQYLRREKLLIRAPSSISAIQGVPLEFTVQLRNVTRRPMTVRMEPAAGLSGQVTATSLRLAPGKPVALSLSGKPEASQITVAANGAAVVHRAPIAVRLVPREEILASGSSGALKTLLDPETHTVVQFAAHLEATTLPHRSGTLQIDAAASGHTAWAARPGQDNPGWIVFGPYATFPNGRYLALFRLRRGAGAGALATLDTCVGGGTPTLASRSLSSTDVPVDAYVSVPLLFDHPGGPLETRVNWAGGIPISLDSIDLWRVGR